MKTVKIGAVATASLIFAACLILIIQWAKRPSPTSPEGLLAQADQLAWHNNWLAAAPLYVKAEHLFQRRGDRGRALYAHVSQFAVRMEYSDLSSLIAELNRDLDLPSAAEHEVRLRILEMKAKCEEEYDAGIAVQTFAEIERLALKQHKLYLASRASGEQGILAFTLGNLAEARSRVKRAYAVAKYLGDPAAHVRYAEMIGMGIEQLGEPMQALVFLDEAIATQKRHSEVALPFVAYGGRVECLGQLGRYKEALGLSNQVASYSREHRLYGQLESILSSRADVLVRAHKTSEAISAYQEALGCAKMLGTRRAITRIDSKLAAAFESSGMLTHALSAIDEALEANKHIPDELFLVPSCMTIKARILAELGRRVAAERVYEQGADTLDALLAHVPTPEAERLLLTELGDLYSGFFELLSDEGRYADAFRVIEQAHGRIEAQELEYNQTEIPHAPTLEDERLQRLQIDLVNTENQRKQTEILDEIEASPGSGSTQRTDERTTTLANAQGQLHADELLIEYVLSTRRSYALAISRSRVARYVLPSKKVIEEDVAKYRDTLRKQGTDSALGQQLFRELLGFTREDPEATSLIVVADGAIHLLPFSALVDGSGKYLVSGKSVSMAPSATVLTLLRNRVDTSSARRPYLGVAAWTEVAKTKPWILRAVSGDSKTAELPPLPESRDEVESIAAMMPQQSTVLIGREATKEKFESLPLGEYRILHLALHGFVDPVFPDRSALVFAPSTNDNGRLEARDIQKLHLKADLVTLSACDTGVGPVGVLGIDSIDAAFIEAGASSVVSTLWELEDRSASTLMKAFYEHLNQESKADALRDAQLELMRAGLAPYYWAAYEVVGNPRAGALPAR